MILAPTGVLRIVKMVERRVTLPLELAPEASASLLGYAPKKNGRASGYCALYSGLEDRRVSINTYARKMESRKGVAPL